MVFSQKWSLGGSFFALFDGWLPGFKCGCKWVNRSSNTQTSMRTGVHDRTPSSSKLHPPQPRERTPFARGQLFFPNSLWSKVRTSSFSLTAKKQRFPVLGTKSLTENHTKSNEIYKHFFRAARASHSLHTKNVSYKIDRHFRVNSEPM